MKILYFSNSRLPTKKAHGHQIMKMAYFFSQQNITVELIVPSRKNPQHQNISPFKFYGIKKTFLIKKIFSYDPAWLIKFKSGIYIKTQAMLFIFSLFIYLLFKPNKSDYIFYTRDEYLLPLLQIFSGTVVWEAHSLPKKHRYYLKYFKKCNSIIVLTHELKKILIKIGLKPEHILVSADAVEINMFGIKLETKEARKILGLPQSKIILGYSGSYKTKNMDKGIKDILSALSMLYPQFKHIFFVAVGGSQKEIDFYQKIAENKKISDLVKFIPRIQTERLAIFQQACDIMMMPFPWQHHFAYFMSPLKMFEYMASHRPIIATNLPSIKEVLNQNNSVIVEHDNPQSLAQGIKNLIEHPDLRQKISNQAWNDVQKYSWQQRVSNIIKFIKRK